MKLHRHVVRFITLFIKPILFYSRTAFFSKAQCSSFFYFQPNNSIKKGGLILLFLLLSIVQSQAQTPSEQSAFFDRVAFKAGYYGNLTWDNGLNLGLEYIWKERTKIKQRKKGEERIIRQVLFHGNIGYSTNFATPTDKGMITYYGLIWRRTNPKGKQLSIDFNPIGYYRAFLPETYEVIGDEVSKVSFPSRGYYAPSIAFGLGKWRKGKTRSGWYLNLRYTLRTPYNAGTLPIYSLEYGHRFNFKPKN